VHNEWNEREAARFAGPLGECVYGSRVIGSNPDLVLHGGGNTSVKMAFADITGEDIPALYVKGSGWDLASIEPAGFTPLPITRLRALLELDALSDPDMMRELSAARLDPTAPQPSVETLLHAYLPYTAVQHSHADAIVTLTNVADGAALVRQVFGDSVVVIPYVMPGFDLAKRVVELWPQQVHEDTVGMVLLNHGLFTFGDTTRQAYHRHVDLISMAEEWLDSNAPPRPDADTSPETADPLILAGLRREISEAAGAPMIMTRHSDATVAGFVARPDLAGLACRGPLTPDHVIRTKRHPMVGRDVAAYTAGYARYFEENADRARTDLRPIDPAPRVVLDPGLGMLAVGRTVKAAAVAADIYRHTIPVLERAEDHLGGYVALDAGDLFDVEYWDLEQAKLSLAGPPPPFAGMVGVVTGAASGIGRACAAELLDRGCAVVGLDIHPDTADAFDTTAWLGARVDVTDAAAVRAAVRAGVERFGGVDVAVVAAGIFEGSAPIAELDAEIWRKVHAINVDSVMSLFVELHPFLCRSPVGGRVGVIGSKNVPAPGKGAAAYSSSKAALTQLCRIAALEWAADGIRVNLVHPDGVFDTGLWTEGLLAERAARYGLTVEEYKRRNLLGAEITSADVAAVVADLCSDRYRATTGAQIPIDGGNERVV
jgi:rhamnose utilization protein RhaD (predicted bifunctional aldolase and dehydrogenase)/NAD(P)-dependent dehydrogenase (short-subunit alcohol dehydrogenase family)